jgi:hypothetical protein
MIGDGCWFVGVASALLQSICFYSIALYVDSIAVGTLRERVLVGSIDRLKYEYTPDLKL